MAFTDDWMEIYMLANNTCIIYIPNKQNRGKGGEENILEKTWGKNFERSQNQKGNQSSSGLHQILGL